LCIVFPSPGIPEASFASKLRSHCSALLNDHGHCRVRIFGRGRRHGAHFTNFYGRYYTETLDPYTGPDEGDLPI